uniref:Uncharacterized protein n=1 Tax=Macrostomum lignano TaxID=282301 RepID=A0A1I8H0Y2_9PLAT
MFHEYTFSEKRSRTHTEQQQPNQQIEQNSSSDTDEMTDDHLSEQDEISTVCERSVPTCPGSRLTCKQSGFPI